LQVIDVCHDSVLPPSRYVARVGKNSFTADPARSELSLGGAGFCANQRNYLFVLVLAGNAKLEGWGPAFGGRVQEVT